MHSEQSAAPLRPASCTSLATSVAMSWPASPGLHQFVKWSACTCQLRCNAYVAAADQLHDHAVGTYADYTIGSDMPVRRCWLRAAALHQSRARLPRSVAFVLLPHSFQAVALLHPVSLASIEHCCTRSVALPIALWIVCFSVPVNPVLCCIQYFYKLTVWRPLAAVMVAIQWVDTGQLPFNPIVPRCLWVT